MNLSSSQGIQIPCCSVCLTITITQRLINLILRIKIIKLPRKLICPAFPFHAHISQHKSYASRRCPVVGDGKPKYTQKIHFLRRFHFSINSLMRSICESSICSDRLRTAFTFYVCSIYSQKELLFQ